MTPIRQALVALSLLPACAAAAGRPDFSFAVLADVQYADQDTAGKRDYRGSAAKLESCAAALRGEKVEFTIQLGDLVDRGLDNLERILPFFNRLPGPRYHVLGNHDLSAGREAALQRLGLSHPYYTFEVKGWHFIVLDGMAVSAHDAKGREVLARLRSAGAPNAQEWNGGLGEVQIEWLHQRLHDATAVGEHAIVFCHFPALPESSTPEHVLWDYRETLELLESEPATVAYLAGHDHRGGYAERGGVHYLTLRGLVESRPEESCQVVDVYPDRLVMRSAGRRTGRTLPLRP
jgi:3',5'-cyclic AMP phosphodiesterase CpdA